MSFQTQSLQIRRATREDARGLHEAHMRSVREVCSKDYSAEEIRAWGYGPFNEEWRVRSIETQFVWVVEDSNQIIQGYAHFGFQEKGGEIFAHIFGLYLAPPAIGLGLGRTLMEKIFSEVQDQNVPKIILESTLTAKAFYEKMGFRISGAETTVSIGGLQIRCIPMVMEL